MKPSFFNNIDMDIYMYEQTKQYDEYGEQISKYTYQETIEADMQPMNVSSQLQEFGKILTDTYKVYLPTNTTIEDTSHLRINGSCYEIIGSPSNNNHVLPHIKIVIRKLQEEEYP